MILGVVLLITGLTYLKGFNPLSKQIHLFAVYDKIEGLAVSNPVLVNGFKVGQVTDVHFLENGNGALLVEFMIEESKLKIPIDSDAQIYSSDLFGTKAIKIKPGITDLYIQDGDTLFSSVEMDITAAFEDDATQGLPSAFESMQRTLRTLENTAENLDGLVDENRIIFTRVMSNVDDLALNLSNNNKKITNIISNFSDLSDSLVEVDIGTTMAKADRAMEEITVMTKRVNNGEGTLGKLMVDDSLYNGLVESNIEIQELLDDLQLNPWKYVRVSLFGRKQDAKMSKGDLKRMEKMIREEIEKQQ
jgi:phospholipid/cholesterol/gamma-HCH transport system substrate-binding protein